MDVWTCVWHRRVEECAATFGDQIEINTYDCSVSSNAIAKLERAARGGMVVYAEHMGQVNKDFSRDIFNS
ncbi:MAG: hypothetical protein ACFBSG_02505 [Leptolyngbyaceae cyanobacterium]